MLSSDSRPRAFADVATISPHFAAGVPRWGVPRKMIPTVDNARYWKLPPKQSALTMLYPIIRFMLVGWTVNTHLLNDHSTETMADKNQWSIFRIRLLSALVVRYQEHDKYICD